MVPSSLSSNTKIAKSNEHDANDCTVFCFVSNAKKRVSAKRSARENKKQTFSKNGLVCLKSTSYCIVDTVPATGSLTVVTVRCTVLYMVE